MQWREGAQRLIEDALLRVREALAADEAQVVRAAADLAVARAEADGSAALAAAAAELRAQLAGLEEAEAEQEYLLSAVLLPGVQELSVREAALADQLAARATAPPPGMGGDADEEEGGDGVGDSDAEVRGRRHCLPAGRIIHRSHVTCCSVPPNPARWHAVVRPLGLMHSLPSSGGAQVRGGEAEHAALRGLLPWAPSRLGADGGSLELPLGLRLDFAAAGGGRIGSVVLADIQVGRGRGRASGWGGSVKIPTKRAPECVVAGAKDLWSSAQATAIS
jgi:hypothetical protein